MHSRHPDKDLLAFDARAELGRPALEVALLEAEEREAPGLRPGYEGFLALCLEVDIRPLQAEHAIEAPDGRLLEREAQLARVQLEQRADRAVRLDFGVLVPVRESTQTQRVDEAGVDVQPSGEVEALLRHVDGHSALFLVLVRFLACLLVVVVLVATRDSRSACRSG